MLENSFAAFGFADPPAHTVTGLLFRICFLRSEKKAERAFLEEAGSQQCGAEADQVLRCRKKASAGPFVTVIDVRSVFERTIFLARIEAGALLDEGTILVGHGGDEAGREENATVR